MLISLADYGVGNLHSIKKSLENAGAKVVVINDMKEILNAECLVLPGVGAFDKAMEKLAPYREDVCDMLASGVPALCICVGTQILFNGSDEGSAGGLGFISGRVKKLKAGQIPHMGWNSVDSDDDLLKNVESRHFYFAHSYYCEPSDNSVVIGTTEHGGVSVPALFRKMNAYGCQFHPEKSSSSGNVFIKNFLNFAREKL